MWTKEKIIERIYYWKDEMNFARDFHRFFRPKNIKRRDLIAPSESPALVNAEFDSAFGTLTKTEQYLLIELYGKDSGLNLDNTYSEEALNKATKETGLTEYGVATKVRFAIGTMLNYLNKGE